MRNKMLWTGISIGIAIGLLLATTGVALAGLLNPSVGPTEAGSQMYTLEQIWQRLNNGAAGAKMTTFTEPTAGPGTGTMHTLDDIMAIAPALDNTNGAASAQVLSGQTFWGLTSGQWGATTGAMPNNGAVTITPGTTAQTIVSGYHNGSGSVEGDADLVAGNIRHGTTIFGVTGSLAPGAVAKRVAKTGQTQCWNNAAELIPCAGTGQDGEYQMGIEPAIAPTNGATGAYTTPAWTGVRFTDNGDGTVTDNLTTLIWLKNANCWGAQTWVNTMSYANGLASGSCGLSDGSSAGDWRLPNINELHSLIDLTQSLPALPAGHPFTGVQSNYYWSSTSVTWNAAFVWFVDLRDGQVWGDSKWLYEYYVWPVRGGQ